MTRSTVIYGILLMVSCFVALGGRDTGLLGIFQLIMGIVMLCVLCNKKSVGRRKCIFYTYVVYTILFFLGIITVFILLFAVEI